MSGDYYIGIDDGMHNIRVFNNRGVNWANATPTYSSDYNGFRPNRGAAAQYRWLAPQADQTADEPKDGDRKSCETLQEFRSATGREMHDIEVNSTSLKG